MNKADSLLLYFMRLLHCLRSPEHQEYVTLLVAAIEARVIAIGDAELTDQWNIFINYVIMEDFLYKKPKSAEETGEITTLNEKRTVTLNYILTSIGNIIKRSPLAADVEKAKHLDHVSEPYKQSATKNIPTKSADIRNFVQDIMQEPYATYATDLNLMQAFLTMKAENDELEINYVKRAKLWQEKDKYGTLTMLRPLEDEALEDVADTLKFLYRTNERGAKDDAARARFEGIAADWNALTEQFYHVLAQRGTTVSLKKPSPDYPMPPANPQPPSPPTPPPFGE